MKSYIGKRCRIRPGVADRLNAAFKAVGVPEDKSGPIVRQSESTFTIGGVMLKAVRSYTTERSLEFDRKVHQAIWNVLRLNDIDDNAITVSRDVFRKQVADLEPKFKLGEYGGYFTADYVAKYLEAMKAVQEFLSDPAVQDCLIKADALSELFKREYDEVIS